jgi:hypothetical protein
MATFNNRFTPRLETLDERALMSCTVWADAVAGSLLIQGDGESDQVTIGDDGHGHVTVTATGDGTHTFSGINWITVYTQGGNDTVKYTLWDSLAGNQIVDVFLGGGADTFRATLANGVDLLDDSSLAIQAWGAGGTDVLGVVATGVDVRGGKLRTTIDGGGAGDLINQHYNGKVASGALRMKSFGGVGNDVVLQSMRCKPGSKGSVGGLVDGGDGNDYLTLSMYLPPPITVVQAKVTGGAGNDIVVSDIHIWD